MISLSTMIKAINGFELPPKGSFGKLKIEQYAGYLTRMFPVYVTYDNGTEKKEVCKDANEKFISWFKSNNVNDEEVDKLIIFRERIESLDSKIKKLENDLLSFDYRENTEDSSTQMRLIRLEQLFIINELQSSSINDPANSSFFEHDFNWIKQIDEPKKALLIKYLDEYFQYLIDRPKDIFQINGFKLSRNLKIKQCVGYLTRTSYAFINNDVKPYDEVNDAFISWHKSVYKDSKAEDLRNYRVKVENPSTSVKRLGNELIDDYDKYYIHSGVHQLTFTKQECLIRLEQLLIIYNLSPINIYEFMKNPIAYGKNVLDWIIIITQNLKIQKIKLLLEYLEEHFQYLFGSPKSILKINNLELPIFLKSSLSSPYCNDRNPAIEQYAGYFSRESTVTISYTYNMSFITHNEANNSVLTWFNYIFKEDIEKLEKLESYLNKIENPDTDIEGLERALITHSNTIQFQSLINLEQLFIRYNLPSSLIYEYTKPVNPIESNPDITEWISNIIKKKKRTKIVQLKEYLDEYFNYVINRPKDDRTINEVWDTKFSM